jgi:hypothetical protein
LACVSYRRPLRSYRALTETADGLFHSPSPLPDGTVLAARRPADGSGTHAVVRFDPSDGRWQSVFDDPDWHDIQPRAVLRRDEADGRSSVVDEERPNGKLYGLNVYTTDFERPDWMPPGSVKTVRILEGIPAPFAPGESAAAPRTEPSGQVASRTSEGPLLTPRRILGEAAVMEDGSFHVEVPADTPLELQALDAEGLALRTCGWIWVKNRENRGCIGCHEDGELTPENRFTDAMSLGRHFTGCARGAAAERRFPPRSDADRPREMPPVPWSGASEAGFGEQPESGGRGIRPARPGAHQPADLASFGPQYRAALGRRSVREAFPADSARQGRTTHEPGEAIVHRMGRSGSFLVRAARSRKRRK